MYNKKNMYSHTMHMELCANDIIGQKLVAIAAAINFYQLMA